MTDPGDRDIFGNAVATPISATYGFRCADCRVWVPLERPDAQRRFCGPSCRSKAWDKDHPRADLSKERRARDRAMGLAAGKNDDQLEVVRAVAQDLARRGKPITIDDVRDECERRGLKIVWGNWTGSVFKEVIWEPVGYAQARHKGSHARVVRKWMLER